MCKTPGQEEFGIRGTERRPERKAMQDSWRLRGTEPGRRGSGLERPRALGVRARQCSELDAASIWTVGGEISTQLGLVNKRQVRAGQLPSPGEN